MLSDRASSAAAVAADLSAYLKESPIVLAVSGGSDSTALLTLAAETRKRLARDCRLVAVTVDHALRPESADEARAVAASSARLGVEHRTAVWHGNKPQRGIQAEARAARQALLAGVADDIGAGIILTGHTLDDQAETVLMRSARGDGIGLAGIAPATLYRGRTWFLRPLLGQRRAALRAMLDMLGIDWIDDPSNANEAFERVRMRGALADDPEFFRRTVVTAAQAASERGRIASGAASLIDRHARLADAFTLEVDKALLSAGDEAASLHALRLLVATAGAGEHLPDRERSAALHSALRTGLNGGTLAHARIASIGGALHFARDRRGRAGPSPRFRSPYDALLPSFDWPAASSLARLLGQRPPAAIPST